MTKNSVLLVFQAVDSAELGDMKKRPTRSGRVLASVTRSIFEPKVGSVNWNPAPPRDTRAGGTRRRRSDSALYVRGGVSAPEVSGQPSTRPDASSPLSRHLCLRARLMPSLCS